MWLNMKPYTDQSNKAMATKYIIGISDKKNFIDQQRDMIHLKPGHHMMIKVLPRLVRTTTDFNELQRSQRKCRLSHETEGFSLLKQYSRKGCQFECAMKIASVFLGIIPIISKNGQFATCSEDIALRSSWKIAATIRSARHSVLQIVMKQPIW